MLAVKIVLSTEERRLIMSGHGDSSSSQGSEIPKETEKKVKDLVRSLSNEFQRSTVGPFPTNYPYHIDKTKAEEYRKIARESLPNLMRNMHHSYKEKLKNVEGNSNQEILEERSKIRQDLGDQQRKLYKLYKNLDEDLIKRIIRDQ